MRVYEMMKTQIKRKRYSKERFTRMANVFYMAGQLSDEEYAELIELINQMED